MAPAVNKANVIAMLVFAAIGAGVVWTWQAGERAVLEDQARIWATGIAAPGARVTFDEGIDWADDRWFLFRAYHYVLRASYETKQGPREGSLSFASALRSIDARSPPEVRYDPAQPERFALSWTVERLSTGWAFLCFKWLCGLLWTTLCLWVASLEFAPRQLQALEAAGQSELGSVTRAFGRVAVLLLGALVVMVLWAVADDLWRRWDSYLEVFLGLGLGLGILAAGGWLVQALRARRRRS